MSGASGRPPQPKGRARLPMATTTATTTLTAEPVAVDKHPGPVVYQLVGTRPYFIFQPPLTRDEVVSLATFLTSPPLATSNRLYLCGKRLVAGREALSRRVAIFGRNAAFQDTRHVNEADLFDTAAALTAAVSTGLDLLADMTTDTPPSDDDDAATGTRRRERNQRNSAEERQ